MAGERSPRLRLKLRVKFALLMAAIVALLGLSYRLYFETRILDELEKELEGRALSMARYLSAESVDLILLQDRLALHELLHTSGEASTDFVYAFIVDPRGAVVGHTFPGEFPTSLLSLSRFRAAEGHSVQRIDVLGQHFRHFAVPVHHGQLGVLHLGVRDKALLDRASVVRRELGLLALVLLLFAVVGAYLVGYLTLRPLQSIVRVLERFEPGRRRDILGLQRGDEVGELARKIDEVTARLDENYRQMKRAERVAAVGTMAAGIAHEINNPITGVENCLRRIREAPQNTAQVREYTDLMLAATEQMGEVVRGLLDFARATPTSFLAVDLDRVVDKALHLVAIQTERRGIEVARTGRDGGCIAQGDEAQLIQVMVNLLVNAVDAMAVGGRLLVHVSRDGDDVLLRVEDDGQGIPEGTLARVFDPFYTTKEAGRGTGLGLAVSQGIVLEHRGDIEIESKPGEGTVVSIRLPASKTCPGGDHGTA